MAAPGRIRVLVAEDDFLVSDGISRALRQVGYEHVGTAPNGRKALEMVASLRPDVILMDIQMPEMDGLEAARKVQELCPTPVVVLTAHETRDLVDQAGEAGVAAYLTKPPGAGDIERAVTIALARHGDLAELRRRDGELTLQKAKLDQALAATHHELAVARSIQQSLHPRVPQLTGGYDIAGACYPCEAVGGDYFDLIPMLDDCLGVVLGDTSGHGLGPALLTAEVQATLRALACTYCSVGEIFTLANRLLCDNMPEGYFVTLAFARLELRGRMLVYCSAGHPPPLILNRQGRARESLASVGPPLGVQPGYHFVSSGAIVLVRGQTLLLYSDGLTEAASPDGEVFGVPRMVRGVRRRLHLPARRIADGLYQDVLQHCHPGRPLDDVSAVVVKVNSFPPEPRPMQALSPGKDPGRPSP